MSGPNRMIKILKTTQELIQLRQSFSKEKVGFVPTMGNLHLGHISLLEKSMAENEVNILSIFVNPKQFGPNEDFSKYPRTLEQDVEKVQGMIKEKFPHKTLYVFAPQDAKEIYPEGFSTNISVGEMTTMLCGKSRPGHFDGVTTVVYVLFSLVKPNLCYMGEKDFQQVTLIKKMVEDMRLPIDIVAMPIVRSPEGLALSSRNGYLSLEQIKDALVLPKTLNEVAQLLKEKKSTKEIQEKINTILKNKNWDYLEICDKKTLKPSQNYYDYQNVVILGAMKAGPTRLIDNIVL